MILDDPGISQILAAFLLNFFLFSLAFLFFSILRKCRTKTIRGKDRTNAIFSESDTPLLTLFKNVYRTDTDKIYELCGLEAFMYISLLKQIILALSVMSFFGLLLLVPLYLTADYSQPELLDRMGINNAIQDTNAMWVVIIFYVFYSLLCYFNVYYIAAAFNRPMKTVKNFAIEIKGIPQDLSASEATEKLKNKFLPRFEELISNIYVVPNFTEAYKDYLKVKKTTMKMESFGEGVEIRKKYYLQRVNAKEYYREKIQIYNEDYSVHLSQSLASNSGIAYIMCRSPQCAFKLVKETERSYDDLKSFLWSISVAPAPDEIIWENIGSNYLLLRGRKRCLMALFIVLFFILLTPTTFSSIIDILVADLLKVEIIEALLSQYIPTIVLLLYQSVVLRQSVFFLVSKEKHTSTSSETLSALVKFLLFMGFYVFIYQLIGIQALSMASMIIQGNVKLWRDELANSLMFSGSLYTIYIIQQTFISLGIDLLQIGNVIMTEFSVVIASNEKEKERAYDAPPFVYGYEFSTALTSFMIILCFSISFPVIVPFGLFYFCMRLCIHKYLILCVNAPNPLSTGVKLPKVCVQSLMSSIFMFQLITYSIIILNASERGIKTASFLWMISIVVFLGVFFNTRRIIKRTYDEEQDEEDDQKKGVEVENIYIHPIEKIEGIEKIESLNS